MGTSPVRQEAYAATGVQKTFFLRQSVGKDSGIEENAFGFSL
jgi:hypothetical protein